MDILLRLKSALLALSSLVSIASAQSTPPAPFLTQPGPPSLPSRSAFISDREETFYLLGLLSPDFETFKTLHAIAEAESGYRSVRNTSSTASGIFQITAGTAVEFGCLGDRMDPAVNVPCALRIFEEVGTVRWDASKPNWIGKI